MQQDIEKKTYTLEQYNKQKRKIRHIFKTTYISTNLSVFFRWMKQNRYTQVYYAIKIQIVRHDHNSRK